MPSCARPYDRYVRNDSNFWNASGVSISLGANGIHFEMESLRAVLLGGIAFDTAHDSTAPISPSGQRFKLYANIEEAKSAGFGQQIKLISYFPGSVAGVTEGAEVRFHGLKIGEVTRVGLVYDPKTDRVVAPSITGSKPAGSATWQRPRGWSPSTSPKR